MTAGKRYFTFRLVFSIYCPSSSGFDQSHVSKRLAFQFGNEQPRKNYGQNKLVHRTPSYLIQQILQLFRWCVHFMVVSWEEGRLKILLMRTFPKLFLWTQHTHEFQSMVGWFIDSYNYETATNGAENVSYDRVLSAENCDYQRKLRLLMTSATEPQ